MNREPEVIWLTEMRTYGFLVSRQAYISTVRVGEMVFDISNDDYELWEDHAIDYDEE